MCEAIKNPPIFFKPVIDYCKKYYGDICLECPYPAGKVALNFTDPGENLVCPKVTNRHMPNFLTGKWFPDGDYKYNITVYSKNDDKIGNLVYYFRMNTGDRTFFK